MKEYKRNDWYSFKMSFFFQRKRKNAVFSAWKRLRKITYSIKHDWLPGMWRIHVQKENINQMVRIHGGLLYEHSNLTIGRNCCHQGKGVGDGCKNLHYLCHMSINLNLVLKYQGSYILTPLICLLKYTL